VTDDRMEGIIGNLLRAGVILAAIIVAAGGAWYLLDAGFSPVNYHHFQAQSHGMPERLILTGLLILIGTPVARVAFSMIAFALERDWLYVGITAVVLAALLYSVVTALSTGRRKPGTGRRLSDSEIVDHSRKVGTAFVTASDPDS
jgi:uncharacterized membrane protein